MKEFITPALDFYWVHTLYRPNFHSNTLIAISSTKFFDYIEENFVIPTRIQIAIEIKYVLKNKPSHKHMVNTTVPLMTFASSHSFLKQTWAR